MKFDLPQTLEAILDEIESNGGRVFFVGGYVRDYLMEDSWPSKDIDLEIFCFDLERLKAVLEKFGNVSQVGRAYGILKLDIFPEVDFALARQEIKIGKSHQDFQIALLSELDIEKAASRRDFTINAIYVEYKTGLIHDPYGGQRDLKGRILKMVSQETFKEDPLRVLRLAQFMARFNFKADKKTQLECEKIVAANELDYLSKERVFHEYDKMLLGPYPGKGIRFLRDINGLVKPLQEQNGTMQRLDYHPEGNVLNHTILVVELASLVKHKTKNSSYFMWANLLHDIGKPVVTTSDLHAPYHAQVGVQVFENELSDLIKSKEMAKYLKVMIRYHMSLMNMARKSNQDYNYLKLLQDIEPDVSLEELFLLTKCDKLGRKKEGYQDYKLVTKFVSEMAAKHGTKALQPYLRGRDLVAWALPDPKRYGRILAEAYDLQLQGKAKDNIIDIIRGKYGK